MTKYGAILKGPTNKQKIAVEEKSENKPEISTEYKVEVSERLAEEAEKEEDTAKRKKASRK